MLLFDTLIQYSNYLLGWSGSRFKSISTWLIVHCIFSNFCKIVMRLEMPKELRNKDNKGWYLPLQYHGIALQLCRNEDPHLDIHGVG